MVRYRTFQLRNQVRIAESNGVESDRESAISARSKKEELHRWGRYALCPNAAFNQKGKVRIAEAGGVEAVVAALRAHPDNAEVQWRGCRALGNLAASNRSLGCK